jgi:hypothetical protein
MGEVLLTPGGRPPWAERMRSERAARGWSQADAVRALQAHADKALPAPRNLLRNWKRWEAGDAEPDDFHKRLIAKTFGTVTAAFSLAAPPAATPSCSPKPAWTRWS